MGVSFSGREVANFKRLAGQFAPAIGLVAVQLVFFGMPAGAWIRGVVLGLLIALLAVGMALVYRANRVINFAQADLGFVPTSLAVGLIVFSGLPYLLRIRRRPRCGRWRSERSSSWHSSDDSPRHLDSMLTVATIGITQLLAALALLVPRMWGDESAASQRIPPPIDWKVTIGIVHPVGQRPHRADRRTARHDRRRRLPRLDTDRHGDPRLGRAQRAGTDARHPGRLAVDARLGDRRGPVVPRAVPARRQSSACRSAPRSASPRSSRRSPRSSSADSGICRRSPRRRSRSAFSSTAWHGTPAVRCWSCRSSAPQCCRTAAPAPPVQPGRSRRGSRLAPRRRGPSAPASGRPAPLVRLMRWGTAALIVVGLALIPIMLRTDQIIKATAVAVFAVIGLSLVVLSGWAGQISLGQMAFVAIGAAVEREVHDHVERRHHPRAARRRRRGCRRRVRGGSSRRCGSAGSTWPSPRWSSRWPSNSWFLNRQFFGWIPQDRVERLPAVRPHRHLARRPASTCSRSSCSRSCSWRSAACATAAPVG